MEAAWTGLTEKFVQNAERSAGRGSNYVCLLKFDPCIRHPVEYKSKEWLIL